MADQETSLHSLYTVQRIRRDDTLYGPIHGSDYGEKTLCGKELCEDWYILTNDFEGVITCKKCLKEVVKPRPRQ